ncbi:hypothetical protein F5Y08DRAFT_189970 [Xylaria arbuscula]|nr:hypothetical protein F5Y08DRAFT_189970 [Xylaria arbuscula]
MATKKGAVRGSILPPAATVPKPSSSTKDTTTTMAEATLGEKEASPYSQALSRLEPLRPILLGIAHRNHNQHRRAAWWRHFGLLRRNCARLVEVLVEAVATAQKNAARAAKASKAKNKKRRREELMSGGAASGPRQNEDMDAQAGAVTDENVVKYATWIRDVLVPKCYLAFSQLTADTQFAPIGVVLLGALAQLQAACDIAVPKPAAAPSSSPSAPDVSVVRVAAADSQPPPALENATTTGKDIAPSSSPAAERKAQMSEESRTASGAAKEDRSQKAGGKAISREAVERAAAQRGKDKERGKSKGSLSGKSTAKLRNDSQAKGNIEGREAPAALPPSKRQVPTTRESGADADTTRPAKKMKTSTVTTTRDEEKDTSADKDKKKKKKKKLKEGDAFDDLFKGLL